MMIGKKENLLNYRDKKYNSKEKQIKKKVNKNSIAF
jgi:hypothetical protein